MITQINTIAVYVEDQEKALTFYIEKLGFEVRFKASMGPGVTPQRRGQARRYQRGQPATSKVPGPASLSVTGFYDV